jgi:hypothetical protein
MQQPPPTAQTASNGSLPASSSKFRRSRGEPHSDRRRRDRLPPTNVDAGFDVGAGLAWDNNAGHVEGIGYADSHATWGTDTSGSQSLMRTIADKLGADASATTWLVGAALEIVSFNIKLTQKLYGLIGDGMELHLPCLTFQANWEINKYHVVATGTLGLEGQMDLEWSIGWASGDRKTPLQIGYSWPLFTLAFKLPCITAGPGPQPGPRPGPRPPALPSPSPSPPPPPRRDWAAAATIRQG